MAIVKAIGINQSVIGSKRRVALRYRHYRKRRGEPTSARHYRSAAFSCSLVSHDWLACGGATYSDWIFSTVHVKHVFFTVGGL
jgi:hypothetical protein